jgi:MinD-like ATPase involved in chromosome partitioning or flagellar assembly
MGEFDLDLGSIEENMPEDDRRVILDVLDGSSSGEQWVRDVASGNVLVLHVRGELDELVGEFAEDIKEFGGSITHFRSFLVIVPPDVEIDTDRL